MKKITALLLVLVTLVSMMAGCGSSGKEKTKLVDPGWVEPVYDEIEDTLENRQAALTATALAYYYKGNINQYGLQDLTFVDEYQGGNLRGKTLEANSPEENTEDLTLYQWCSSYVYDIVYQTMGYKIANDYVFCRTGAIAKGERVDAIIVEHMYNNTGNEAVDKARVDPIYADLQPGDIVTWNNGSNGHSLMVVQDFDNDGTLNVLHRNGGRYEMATGKDYLEAAGITKTTVETFTKGNNSIYTCNNFSVIRVTNLDPAQYPLTNAAKARLAWPGLRIDRTVSGGVLGSVVPGGELTYTIVITNNSDKDHVDMPVMDAVAENCTMVSVDGKKATTTYPVWSVDIPAGESVTLTYTVKVNGKVGEQVVSKGGSVAGIPSNCLVTTIQSATRDAAKMQDEAKVASAAAASTSNQEFVNKMYEAAYGKNPGIKSIDEIMADCLDNFGFAAGQTIYQAKENLFEASGNKMIHTYIGGRTVITGANDRILETRMSDLQPGDIIVGRGIKAGKPVDYFWIYDGEFLLSWEKGKVKELKQPELTKLLSFYFFMGFRPTLAG